MRQTDGNSGGPSRTRGESGEWPFNAPDDATAQLFRVLGHPVRLRILWLLAHKEEFGIDADPCCDGDVVCVCRIKALVDISAPLLSHHLRVLREAGLVEARRMGIWTHYTLCPSPLQPLAETLSSFQILSSFHTSAEARNS